MSDDLEHKPLSQLCTLLNGLAFKPEDWSEYGHPIIRIQNLNGSTDFNFCNRPVPNQYIIPPNTVLFSWSGNRGTSFGPYWWKGPVGVLNQHIFKVSPKPDIYPRWLYYGLDLARQKAERQAHGGSGLVHVRRTDFLKYKIPAPSLAEQHHIAEILDTIDEAIQKTEALISKLKAMKQGLLHDLLTRGLDKNGKLRDPKAHPEKFKASPMGRIPKAWETAVLRDEVDIFHGYAFEGNYFSERPPGEVLLVPGNFHREGKLYFEKDNTKYFRGPIPKGTVLNNGDILIVMTDLSPRTLILGRVVQLEAHFRVLHNQRIGKIVFKNAETWCKLFFVAIMNDEKFRHNIILNATGTTVRHTSPDRILSNMLVKPQLEEQKRLAIVVDGQDSRIRTEERYRDKLKLQKKGLMHDLLTGKVRVKI